MKSPEYKIVSRAALLALLFLPSISHAAGVDIILYISAIWLISFILAVISIVIANNKLKVFYIHIASASFLFISTNIMSMIPILDKIGANIIIFFYYLIYPVVSTITILVISLRWRAIYKKVEESDNKSFKPTPKSGAV